MIINAHDLAHDASRTWPGREHWQQGDVRHLLCFRKHSLQQSRGGGRRKLPTTQGIWLRSFRDQGSSSERHSNGKIFHHFLKIFGGLSSSFIAFLGKWYVAEWREKVKKFTETQKLRRRPLPRKAERNLFKIRKDHFIQGTATYLGDALLGSLFIFINLGNFGWGRTQQGVRLREFWRERVRREGCGRPQQHGYERQDSQL